jgi:hypothetical protein
MIHSSTQQLERNMNKDKMIELLENGASFDWVNRKFFHPSFRKGFRTISSSNISWLAVERVHGTFGTNRLVEIDNVFTLKAA